MTEEPKFFNIPEPHATFLRNALEYFKKVERLVGIAATLHSAADLYHKLRRQLADRNVSCRLSAEKAAMNYLGEIEARCGLETGIKAKN